MLYVDPGSGTLIWQLIISFFLGAIFHLGKFKGWILSRTQRAITRRAATRTPFSGKENSTRVTQIDPPADL